MVVSRKTHFSSRWSQRVSYWRITSSQIRQQDGSLLYSLNPTLLLQLKRKGFGETVSTQVFSGFFPPSCINRALLSGTWQLASLHQRVKEVSSPLCKLIIPHFTSINPGVTLRTSPRLSIETELELGEMRADGGQAGGLMNSNVVAMSEA